MRHPEFVVQFVFMKFSLGWFTITSKSHLSGQTNLSLLSACLQVAQGTTLQICTINISPHSITLDDSIKSGISRKHIPIEKVSYCGLAR